MVNFINTNATCDMFEYNVAETDQDNALMKVLSDKLKIMKYTANTTAVLWDKNSPSYIELHNEDSVGDFA